MKYKAVKLQEKYSDDRERFTLQVEESIDKVLSGYTLASKDVLQAKAMVVTRTVGTTTVDELNERKAEVEKELADINEKLTAIGAITKPIKK